MGRKLIGDKWSLLPAKYAMDEELPHRLVRHPTGLRDVMRKLNYYYFFFFKAKRTVVVVYFE